MHSHMHTCRYCCKAIRTACHRSTKLLNVCSECWPFRMCENRNHLRWKNAEQNCLAQRNWQFVWFDFDHHYLVLTFSYIYLKCHTLYVTPSYRCTESNNIFFFGWIQILTFFLFQLNIICSHSKKITQITKYFQKIKRILTTKDISLPVKNRWVSCEQVCRSWNVQLNYCCQSNIFSFRIGLSMFAHTIVIIRKWRRLANWNAIETEMSASNHNQLHVDSAFLFFCETC